MYNNGHEFGARYVGELQALSNIEGVSTWRLYEIWADYSCGAKISNSVRFGLYNFNTEFNALDAVALFINSSHGIGPDVSQAGLHGPSNFPVTGLALRVKGSTGLHLDSTEGALLGWRYTAQFDSIDEVTASGDPVRARGNQGFYVLAELTWRAPLTECLTVQPTLQYVVNPGTDPRLANAWTVGLRVELSAAPAR